MGMLTVVAAVKDRQAVPPMITELPWDLTPERSENASDTETWTWVLKAAGVIMAPKHGRPSVYQESG